MFSLSNVLGYKDLVEQESSMRCEDVNSIFDQFLNFNQNTGTPMKTKQRKAILNLHPSMRNELVHCLDYVLIQKKKQHRFSQ